MRAWVAGWVLGCAATALADEQPEQRPPEVVRSKQDEVTPAPGGSAAAAPTGAVPAAAAQAPSAAPLPETVIDVKQPEREWSTGVEKPPAGPGREVFDREAISVDAILNEVKRNGKPYGASDFYRVVGRPDLAAWSEDRTRQRTWLIASGTIVAVAGVVTGIIVMGSGPGTSTPECQTHVYADYNDCYDRASKAQMTGAFILGAGLAAGGVLFVWGMNIPEMVTPAETTLKLATDYNQSLSIKHGGSPPSSGMKLRVLPAVGPGFAGLSAKLTF